MHFIKGHTLLNNNTVEVHKSLSLTHFKLSQQRDVGFFLSMLGKSVLKTQINFIFLGIQMLQFDICHLEKDNLILGWVKKFCFFF